MNSRWKLNPPASLTLRRNYFVTRTNETLIYSCFQLKRKSLTKNIYGVTFFSLSFVFLSPSSHPNCNYFLVAFFSPDYVPKSILDCRVFFPYIAKDEDGEKNVVLMYFSRPVTRIFSPSAFLFFFIFIFYEKRKARKKYQQKIVKCRRQWKVFPFFLSFIQQGFSSHFHRCDFN